ncbi:MAG: Smr/MutS family protein [Proteobacteria bacterium]|nr:Smr/MutS family protein [Pseudomonadota bacterium]
MVLCQVCGNDIGHDVYICPFCGGKQEKEQPEAISVGVAFHKVVNLEMGKPLVESALRKLQMELESGRRQNLRVLTVIHGYGSTGKGGAIGVECRKVLEYLKGKGEIGTFIPGEEFRMKSGLTRDLLRRFPQLANNVNLNKGNRGITLIVL